MNYYMTAADLICSWGRNTMAPDVDLRRSIGTHRKPRSRVGDWAPDATVGGGKIYRVYVMMGKVYYAETRVKERHD